jgi:hypothetical protein
VGNSPRLRELVPKPMLRMCIGTPDGLRSTVWKVWTHRDSAYIQSRMMGSEVKVSLHGRTGQGHWSRTDEWVKRAGVPNKERHIVKWNFDVPTSTQASRVFRLVVPASELQPMGIPRNHARILWIDGPVPGQATNVELYLSPAPPEKLTSSKFPYAFVGALPLDPRRSLVLLEHRDPMLSTNLETLTSSRHEIASIAQSLGIPLRPGQRATAFLVDPDGVRGMLEMNPVGQ